MTNPGVQSCSCEAIPEGKAHILHLNSHFMHTYTETHTDTHSQTQTHRHTNIALSFNFFPHLSSYSSYPTHLFYAFVRVCLCSSVSFKFPLYSPCFLLSFSFCLFILLPLLKCWFWPGMCCSAGVHARAEQQAQWPADRAPVPGFAILPPRGPALGFWKRELEMM